MTTFINLRVRDWGWVCEEGLGCKVHLVHKSVNQVEVTSDINLEIKLFFSPSGREWRNNRPKLRVPFLVSLLFTAGVEEVRIH